MGLERETEERLARDEAFSASFTDDRDARHILETICEVGEFDSVPGRGIAIQTDVEDAVGVSHQVAELKAAVEEEL